MTPERQWTSQNTVVDQLLITSYKAVSLLKKLGTFGTGKAYPSLGTQGQRSGLSRIPALPALRMDRRC